MAPKNKFTRQEMVAAALGTSTQPIFTAFGSMDAVRQEVYAAALRIYDEYAQAGLREELPFFGVGKQYLRFARERPELYRLLFLSSVREHVGMESMRCSKERVRPTLRAVYHLTVEEADRYFRDLWIVVHSLATLIVTGGCTWTEPELDRIMTGFSISICKAIKEIPGFAADDFDRDAVFRAVVGAEP